MSLNDDAPNTAERYMIVSTDSHVGPLMKEQLRGYCPAEYLDRFDEFLAFYEPLRRGTWDEDGPLSNGMPFTEKVRERTRQTTATTGVFEPAQRLADMDADGIAAEVIYHGAMTPEIIPWQVNAEPELQTVGIQIYNRWLADFVAAAPERFVGAAHVPLWDVDAAVREVEWAAEAGLRCVNFPAPNRALPGYNEPVYEPFWSACAATGLPLTTHGGSGDMPPYTGRESWALYMSDLFFFSRRGLWYLTWSGAFERHPNLKMVFTEQRSEWVPPTLAHLDSIYHSEFHDWQTMIPRPPSEYFAEHCFVASSFMARFEAEMRHEIGIDTLMWGTDYPHYEGSYLNTDRCLRATFSEMPVDEVRKILGENAIGCFHLDRTALRSIADRIGPRPDDVAVPLDPADLPEVVGCAFRTRSTWS